MITSNWLVTLATLSCPLTLATCCHFQRSFYIDIAPSQLVIVKIFILRNWRETLLYWCLLGTGSSKIKWDWKEKWNTSVRVNNFKPKCTIFVFGLPKWKFCSNNHHHHQHYAIITVGVLTIIKGLGANPITPWCKNSSTQSSLHRNSHLQQPDHQHPCTHRILTVDTTTTLQKYQSCCRFSHCTVRIYWHKIRVP